MKRLFLFNIYVIGLFFVFEALLRFDKLGSFGAWAAVHESYIGGFVILTSIALSGIIFFKCKWAKIRQSPEAWVQGNAQLKSNIVKSKKLIWWDSASLIVFIACTQLITFSHLNKDLSFLLTIALTVIYMTGILILHLTVHKNQKLRLEKVRQDQVNATLKLRAIRSQLNPHFMFNALTSIQNLMNKNDIAAANHYLSIFADLTRKVLNTGEHDLISLVDELKIQDDYLQMEQLRFGFQYKIQVSDAINKDNTEIPAMLLQPFVENAVKHGIPAKGENGVINITIDKQANNLILAVADNGKGFDSTTAQNQKTSFGLKLSKERVELLNQLYKDQPVTLNIDSTPTGTRVTITLVDLLT